MTLSLPKRIADATGLLEALRIIRDEPDSTGALEISAGSNRARLWFSKGKIIDAEVFNTGDRGQKALAMLAMMPDATITYEDSETPKDAPEELHMSLEEFLSQLSTRKSDQDWDKPGIAPSIVHTEPGKDVSTRISEALEFAHVDEKPFEHSEASLEHGSSGLTEEQQSELTQANENKENDAHFHHIEERLQRGHGFTPEQQEMLDKAREAGEVIETPEAVLEFMRHKGVHLTPEQEADLRAIESLRTKEEQKEEFHQPAGWELTEPIQMAPVAEVADDIAAAEAEKWPTPTDEDRVPLPNVLDVDRQPLKLMTDAPEMRKKRDLGLITRVGKFVNERWRAMPPRRKKQLPFSTEAILGTACIFMMIGCIFILPEMIKNSSGSSAEERAKQRLKKAIHDDLASDSPQETAELNGKKRSDRHVDTAGPRNPNPPPNGASPEYETHDLETGRGLVAKGSYDAAVPYYENYCSLDPNSIQARIELINLYIATKQRHKARLLCIQTLKKHASSAEIAMIWQLFSQCQTD